MGLKCAKNSPKGLVDLQNFSGVILLDPCLKEKELNGGEVDERKEGERRVRGRGKGNGRSDLGPPFFGKFTPYG